MIVDGQVTRDSEIFLSEEFTDTRVRLSQKMWYGYGGIPLFSENLNLLKEQANWLKIPLPGIFEDQRELFRLTKRMLNKNKFYRSGHVLLQLIADGNSVKSIVTSEAVKGFTFPFSEEGVLVTFSLHKKYSPNGSNRFPYYNERLWQTVIAGVKGTPYQQAIILNEHNSVCECAYAALCMIAGNELIYPAPQSGCHTNTLLPVIAEASKSLGLKVSERAYITQEGLLRADELFYVSEEAGMHWILGIDNQRFIHYYSRRINEVVNNLLKSRATSNVLA